MTIKNHESLVAMNSEWLVIINKIDIIDNDDIRTISTDKVWLLKIDWIRKIHDLLVMDLTDG